MNTGQLYINDQDAWLTWGVFMVGDSIDNLLLPPPPKPYVENNFRSQDGKQVFIIDTKKEARDVQVEFCILANSRTEYLQAYKSFVNVLSDGMVTLRVPMLDEVYRLTVGSYLSLGYHGRFGKLAVRFDESFTEPIVYNTLSTEGTNLIITEDGKTITI